MRRVGACALLLSIASGGCVFDDVDLEDKTCPCTSGYTCDGARNRCVRNGADGGAPESGLMRTDGGRDAGGSDAGDAVDAGGDAGTPVPCRVLFVSQVALTPSTDSTLVARIADRFGCEVAVVDQADASADAAAGHDLVVISSTAQSMIVGGVFRGVTAPVLTWEAYVYPAMGMTRGVAGTDFGFTNDLGVEVTITDAAHALAGGFEGSGPLLTSGFRLAWGIPAGEGRVVATTTEGGEVLPAIFYFRRGDQTAAEIAAGCRIGFPLYDHSADALTDAGWGLFEAAVAWALDGCP